MVYVSISNKIIYAPSAVTGVRFAFVCQHHHACGLKEGVGLGVQPTSLPCTLFCMVKLPKNNPQTRPPPHCTPANTVVTLIHSPTQPGKTDMFIIRAYAASAQERNIYQNILIVTKACTCI